MNIEIRGRLWQILFDITNWWTTIDDWPNHGKYRVFRFWRCGPLEVRRFYMQGEFFPTTAPHQEPDR